MCQYNFLILESKDVEKEILEIANSFNLRFQDVMTNFSIPKLRTYVTDLGEDNCNCGSVIGNREYKEDRIFDIEKERKKLERKRFSKNRIEQLLHQKQQEIVLENAKTDSSESKEAEKWIKFFDLLKKRKQSNRIGLLFHQYRTGIAEEPVKIEEELFVDKIDSEALKNLQQDKLYWINHKANR